LPPAPAPPYILELDRITKRFETVTAVDDVSLQVRQGEFLTLLGPSGCGKTTILRMIAGFETPSSGAIRIDQRLMAGIKPYDRPIGIVFQNLALFPHMTAGENIAFGLEVQKLPRAEIAGRVTEALGIIGLPGYEQRRVHALSGGQRQRVALARAFVIRPSLLLLDEPLGALDLKLRRQLQLELKHIQRRIGTTCVLVTHDQEEALTMSDRIAVMNHGRIEQLGTAEEVYARPRSRFVAQFIGDTNLLEGRVAGRDGALTRLSLLGGRIMLRLVLPESARPGDAALVSVRPEAVLLGPAAASSRWQVEGVIEECIHVGAQIRSTVAIGETRLIATQSTRAAEADRHDVGEQVKLSWAEDDVAILPEDAESRD
jgi:spermidine/putrescine ABC transporter ATP-binding subunit